MTAAIERRTASGGRHFPSGGPLKRHTKPSGKKTAPSLPADHPALVEARTLFPSTVTHASVSPRLLVSGINSRKIGSRVVKGRWSGMPIYTLTLEERATCPRSCLEWATCYGNNMNWARRHIADEAFEVRLWQELTALDATHPAGFVIRLHVLGDFYDALYVELWKRALVSFAALRVFGFTAHRPESEVGGAIMALSFAYHDRWRIRHSGTDEDGLGALVINDASDSAHVICPMQRDLVDCCGACGLCWTMSRTVEFVRH